MSRDQQILYLLWADFQLLPIIRNNEKLPVKRLIFWRVVPTRVDLDMLLVLLDLPSRVRVGIGRGQYCFEVADTFCTGAWMPYIQIKRQKVSAFVYLQNLTCNTFYTYLLTLSVAKFTQRPRACQGGQWEN